MNTHLKSLGLALLLAFSAFAQVDTSSIQMFETLDEVEIDRDPGVRLSKKSVLSKELISEVELRKAACCDLSESFETNASISASFTDAVTGTRQIRRLMQSFSKFTNFSIFLCLIFASAIHSGPFYSILSSTHCPLTLTA